MPAENADGGRLGWVDSMEVGEEVAEWPARTCVRGHCKHGRNESPFAMAIVFIAFYLHD